MTQLLPVSPGRHAVVPATGSRRSRAAFTPTGLGQLASGAVALHPVCPPRHRKNWLVGTAGFEPAATSAQGWWDTSYPTSPMVSSRKAEALTRQRLRPPALSPLGRFPDWRWLGSGYSYTLLRVGQRKERGMTRIRTPGCSAVHETIGVTGRIRTDTGRATTSCAPATPRPQLPHRASPGSACQRITERWAPRWGSSGHDWWTTWDSNPE